MKSLCGPLSNVSWGAAVTFENLTLFPLIAGEPGEPDYQTLDEALAKGAARIKEVSEGGTVNQLMLFNDGPVPLLLLDGEELIGARQNRILNLTILAPARTALPIPVSCVEAGRWFYRSAEFAAAPRAQFAEGRARKTAQVTQNMKQSKGSAHGSNQGEVWADIEAKADRMNAHSDTRAMAEIFERNEAKLESYVRAFTAIEGQNGAVFAIQDRIIGMEWFDYPATFRRLLPKLIRSYALDAVEKPRSSRIAPSQRIAETLPQAVMGAKEARYASLGLGEDIRLSGKELAGSALQALGRLVHLSAFRLEK